MYLVELAVEGLASLPSKARLGFRGHVDIVRLDSSEARGAVLDVLFHTLFPDPDRAAATRDLVASNAARRRAVLTVSGRDRVPYRVLRDLATGSARLYRFDRRAGSHALLSESSREAQQFLRVQHQLPDDQSYERLFVFSAASRPSLGARARSRTGAAVWPRPVAPTGPGLPPGGAGGLGAPLPRSPSQVPSPELAHGELTGAFPLPSVLGDAPSGLHAAPLGTAMHNALVQEELELSGTVDMVPESSDAELLARYRALLAERKAAKRRAKAEQTLQVLGEKEDAARRAVEALEKAEARRAELDAQLEAAGPLRELPRDFANRLEAFEALEARHAEERGRLEGELEALREAAGRRPPGPWYRERTVLGGAVAGLAFAVGAVVSGVPWLVLGQIAGGGAAGYGAWRWIERREAQDEVEARLGGLEERAARQERVHRLDTSMVRGILERMGEEDPRSLATRLRELEALAREREAVAATLAGEVGRRGQRAREVLAKVAERKEACERELAREIGQGSDEASLNRRLQSLRAELRARGVDPDRDAGEKSEISVVLGTADLPALSSSSGADEDDEEGYDPGYGGSRRSGGSGPGGALASSGGFAGGALASSGGFAGGALASSGGFAGGAGTVGTYGGGGGGPTRAEILCEAAADLVGQDVESLVEGVRERLDRFVRVLTSGAVARAELSPSGRLGLVTAEGAVAYEDLKGARLDQVDVALRFALLESVLRVRRAPVLIEEPVAALPPERRDVLQRIYAHLAQRTQVVILTPASDLEGHRVC